MWSESGKPPVPACRILTEEYQDPFRLLSEIIKLRTKRQSGAISKVLTVFVKEFFILCFQMVNQAMR
jgi:hypothetical protein